MNVDDRLILAKCFIYSMKVLFAILYAVRDRVDKQLFDDYKELANDLRRWYEPTPPDEADAASVKARWG